MAALSQEGQDSTPFRAVWSGDRLRVVLDIHERGRNGHFRANDVHFGALELRLVGSKSLSAGRESFEFGMRLAREASPFQQRPGATEVSLETPRNSMK